MLDPKFKRLLLRARGSDAMFRSYNCSMALIYCIEPQVLGISNFASLMVEVCVQAFYLLNCIAHIWLVI